MFTQLGLIDYGMGNLHSVEQAFKRLQKPIKRVKKPSDLNNVDALILPGVGSFDPAMDHLKQTKLIPYLKDWAEADRPILGICLGLQLMFESSEEGSLPGLGLLKGDVRILPKDVNERIPHMGWAQLKYKNNCPLLTSRDNSNWVYFVHSYAAFPANYENISATTNFGPNEITAIVWRGCIGACQFHPEKSAKAGQKMLGRWVKWLENKTKNN